MACAVLVDVEIALAFWEQLFHPGDFTFVFRYMGLHVAFGMLFAECTGRLQLLAGARVKT
jgi:hypothetical protein